MKEKINRYLRGSPLVLNIIIEDTRNKYPPGKWSRYYSTPVEGETEERITHQIYLFL